MRDTGVYVRTMEYDMRSFFQSCVELFQQLTEGRYVLRRVPTPFLTDPKEDEFEIHPVELSSPLTSWPITRCPRARRHWPATMLILPMAPSSPRLCGLRWGDAAKHRSADTSGKLTGAPGLLAPIAAQVCMKILYGARAAR